MSKLIFTERAWEEYQYWNSVDKRIFKRINLLLKDIMRNGYNGIGKPEPLRHRDGNSRRIDDTHRLVYQISESGIEIIQCKGHYDE